MSWLEIVATVLTVACVILANFRSTWQYPIGILGTIAFFFVVWSANLFANAGLQIFFIAVQFYGWWFWLKGGYEGTRPKITSIDFGSLASVTAFAVIASVMLGMVLNHFTSAAMATVDAIVFGLSVFAQFLLDRKKLENWIIWGLVNALSIWLYLSAGLYLLSGLYAGLFINAFVAYYMWYKEYNNV